MGGEGGKDEEKRGVSAEGRNEREEEDDEEEEEGGREAG